jgi:MFS family permease
MTPGDALIYLTFTRRADMGVASFPLLYVGASLVFLLAAIPLGRLSDRIGMAKVFIAGELLMLGVFAVLASGAGSLPALLLLLVMLGGYYAATDGVLMALASTIVPSHVRASGLALLTMTMAIGHLVASAAFGALWQVVGSTAASQLFVGGLLAAVVVSAIVLRPGAPARETGEAPARVRS